MMKQEDAAEKQSHWDRNPACTTMSTLFTSNPLIAEEVYRRMSGGRSNKHWLSWVIEDYFAGKEFERLLSPGCGTGDHEILVAKSGIVNHIDAFDSSKASIKIASDNAKQAGLEINFYHDDLNLFVIDENQKYDLVLCSGSLHHTKEIERFLSTVQDALKPDGYFIVNEYVGDCYNIYDERKVQFLDRLYQCFPDVLRSNESNRFRNPTIDEALATDDSESVRSSLILPFLKQYFDLEVFRPFGGQILHPLYGLLNHKELTERDPKTETILRLLLEFEEILMEIPAGLTSDFVFCICRPKIKAT